MSSPRRLPLLLALLVAGAALVPSVGSAQRRDSDETRRLRQAAALESRGDLAGAERVLLGLLRDEPTSSGGLFALERVLRSLGRTQAILAPVDSFLVHEPTSSGVRYLKLRVLQELDSLAALEREGAAWLALAPADAGPYREVARVYERAFGPERALEVLRAGREAAGDSGTLALEIGDLLAASGRPEEALEEWSAAVVAEEGQASAVARRVAGLPLRARRSAATSLLARLDAADGPGARRAATRIAIDLGLDREAHRAAERATDALDGRGRATFLNEVARRAQDASMSELAAWAYRELGQEVGNAAERRQVDERLVELSLAAGDTATALAAQRRVAASYSAGSVDRRRATARVIRLEASHAEPERLGRLLEDFRRDFPQAPELDELSAAVAARLQARGDPEGARSVLTGLEGPRSATERGYLLLDRGELEEARRAFLVALQGLPPEEATEVIQLTSLLGRLSPEGGALLAGGSVLAHQGRAEEAVALLSEGVAELEEEERPTVLAVAARAADEGGRPTLAAELRARILEEHPDAPEVGEAALALARQRARTRDGLESAIRILEDLITSRPNAAVVPDARLELERLRARGG